MSVISKIKIPGSATAVDIAAEWINIKNKPDFSSIDVNTNKEDTLVISTTATGNIDNGGNNSGSGAGLPSTTTADNGKVLGVVNGIWDKINVPNGGGTVEITYAALKTLRNNGQLVPGTFYRMTDYETIITGSYDLSVLGAQGYLHNARSAGHQFDLILLATGSNELSENVLAAHHSGDTYFASSHLEAWQLKYDIDNDTSRFTWANANGKGVIWWMEDEFNNRAGYDFKNIQFLRYALTLAGEQENYTPTDGGLVYIANKQPNRYGSMYHIFMALQAYMNAGTYTNPFLHQYAGSDNAVADYDFAVSKNILGVIQMPEPNETYLSTFGADWYYTFDYYNGTHVDASLNQLQVVPCRENYIELEFDPVAAALMQKYDNFGLGGNVWELNDQYDPGNGWNSCSENKLGVSCFCNTFGNNCHSNTFGNDCYSNTFGDDCQSNIFGNSCDRNIFGNQCDRNAFGNSCDDNIFENSCNNNTFGNSCNNNTFKINCSRNTFGDGCNNNTFEYSCYNNTFRYNGYRNAFGNSCSTNIFEYNCYNNTFGNSCSTNIFKHNCYGNTFGDNCFINTFGNHCSGNTFEDGCTNNIFGNDCTNNTFSENCTNNIFGNDCYSNIFGNYCYYNTFGNSCYRSTFAGSMWYLHCSDHVHDISADTAQYGVSTLTVKVLENYNGMNGHATLITKTGYQQESAIITTDGQTWTAL